MKKMIIRCLLLSLAGLLVILLTLALGEFLPELAQKFLLLLGCGLFGYGIAYIIVEKKTPR